MGIGISGVAGVDFDALRDVFDGFRIGSDKVGIIFHLSEGENLNGEYVEANNWIEIYGEVIQFTEVTPDTELPGDEQ